METKRNFYTVKEVQRIVFDGNISITTLHNLLNKNEIPSVRLCRKVLIPAWWTEAQIKKGRICSN